MEENTNPEESKLDKFTEERVKKGIENLLNEKELKIKWRKELANNTSVIEYFKNFQDSAMDHFLDSYIHTKYLYHTYGDMYQKMSDEKRNKWIDLAHEQLPIILQKQLFDKQCLWRAEQITCEGVEISADFIYWSDDVFNCPFLEPITWEDIEMYQAFLASDGLHRDELDELNTDWQDYREFKASYTSTDDDEYTKMPEWYEFHNSRTGNSKLLLMQDIRGTKEQFYIDLYFKDIKPQRDAEKAERDKKYGSKPFYHDNNHENLVKFISVFENQDCHKKYKYYYEMTHKRDPDEFQEVIDSIIDADESIPISSHYNLIDAVELAYNSYYLKKVAEHLPIAFEHYLFTQKMGVRPESKKINYKLDIKMIYSNQILKGRELNGESRNFDF